MEAFIESWGPLGVFLAIIATGLGFPMPEELPVVIGGGLAGHRSEDKGFLLLMMLACIVGVIIGDLSGMQDFLHGVTSRRAARALRARSFYLQTLSLVAARNGSD